MRPCDRRLPAIGREHETARRVSRNSVRSRMRESPGRIESAAGFQHPNSLQRTCRTRDTISRKEVESCGMYRRVIADFPLNLRHAPRCVTAILVLRMLFHARAVRSRFLQDISCHHLERGFRRYVAAFAVLLGSLGNWVIWPSWFRSNSANGRFRNVGLTDPFRQAGACCRDFTDGLPAESIWPSECCGRTV